MLLFLLILGVPAQVDSSPISCYNDQGVAVDWFYLYKLPKVDDVKVHHQGDRYLLLEKESEEWINGKGTVNDTTGALGKTVGQLYSPGEESERAYILYNDQKPTLDLTDSGVNMSGRRGHTKGMVLLDKHQGFWLVHSTPHFPAAPKAGQYFYPDSGLVNGQNFLCVTYPLEHFKTIGEQLQINQASVYDCDVPPSLATLVPTLAAVCKEKTTDGRVSAQMLTMSNRSVTLTSAGGTNFISFAKGASFCNDLYHAWVAPALQSDLLVQFWNRSTGVRPSDCSLGWKVLDVTQIKPGKMFEFKRSQDHSKWAVSTEAAAPGAGGGWVCVGDINRNVAEEKRGGGTVCLRHPPVWKAYRTAVVDYQDCRGGKM